jgi:hypothetical protein
MGVQAVDAPQRLEKIETERLLFQPPKIGQRIGRVPHRGSHRIISARSTEERTVSVNELSET